MQTSEVLYAAANLIEERGWVKGEGWDWGGDGRPLCLEGAIGVASGIFDASTTEPFNRCPAGRAVRAYLDMTPEIAPHPEWRTYPDISNSALYRWNDNVPNDASEVIEVLRAVAVIEAAREQASVEVSA